MNLNLLFFGLIFALAGLTTISVVPLFALIFVGIGVYLCIVVIVELIRAMIRLRKIKRLKRQGTFVIADVIECELFDIGSRARTKHTRFPHHEVRQTYYYLRCSYQAIGGEVYVYRSDLLREDPIPYLNEGKVNVYCNKAYKKPYFVDVDGSIELGNRVFEI
jgi:hypothetical protein